jgi:signal peptidase I
MLFSHFIRHLTSKPYRKGRELADAVRKVLENQRDQLRPEAIEAVEQAIARAQKVFRTGTKAEILSETEQLHRVADQWLLRYPHAAVRDYLIMAIELAVLILGSRAFFVQPMVIPTGSAQPTFWGITAVKLAGTKDEVVPSWPVRIWDLFIKGDAYCYAESEADGVLENVSETKSVPLIPFLGFATVQIGGHQQKIWFVPDKLANYLDLVDATGQYRPRQFRRGDRIIATKFRSGDHLFVERLTYNFRHPRRGETIVFRSENHPGMTENTHYIKRLVGLGGEKVRIGDDRHVYIDGRQLTTNDDGFEKVYSFDPSKPPESDHYSGHVNEKTSRLLAGRSAYSFNFPDGTAEYTIPPRQYVCFGDNTMNSADSRAWGIPSFPQERVIGKELLVFWPFTERFGWSRH